MKAKFITTIAILVFTVIQAPTAHAQETEKRDLINFTKISLGLKANVYLTQGDVQSLEIKANESTLKRITTDIKKDRLSIGYHKSTSWFKKWNHGNIDIFITVPQVSELRISGSGAIISTGKIESKNLNLLVSGSGNIALNSLLSENVSTSLSGSGNILLVGEETAKTISSKTSGSGKVNIEKFPAESVTVNISGSGNFKVHATKKLNVRISGSGGVIYTGEPHIDMSVSGSGKVKKKQT